MLVQLQASILEVILVRWCHRNACEWGQAHLLDRAGWDSRRRAFHLRGIDLPAAEWVLCVSNSGLYEVVNGQECGEQLRELSAGT